MDTGNIFQTIPEISRDTEVFETIFSNRFVEIERLVSVGVVTPENEWSDQEKAEWVMVLQGEAELTFEDGRKTEMKTGDFMLIEPHVKHRVSYTSTEPACIWLAFHFVRG